MSNAIKLIIATSVIVAAAALCTVILVSAALRGLLWLVLMGLGAMA